MHPVNLVVAALLLALPAAAQAPMPGHQGMRHGPAPAAAAPGAAAPSGTEMTANQQQMMQSMQKMDRDMAAVPMTGNPDRDLVAMMMPHHQGAIDMARIYLRDGRDPEIRRIAQRIITDQQRELRELQSWQRRHPAR